MLFFVGASFYLEARSKLPELHSMVWQLGSKSSRRTLGGFISAL